MHGKKSNIVNEAIQDIENLEDTMLHKKEKHFRKFHKHIRICPHPSSFDYQVYKDLKEVIICNDLDIVAIKRWDELEIDFNNQNIRYSKELNQNIIKVTNRHNYDLIKDTNVSISIPYNGVLHKTLDDEIQQYIKEYVFIQISRRIIMDSGYSEEHDINLIDKSKVIEFILTYIKEDIKNTQWKDMGSWIKQYEEYGVSLVEVLNMNGKGDLFNE